MLAFYLPFACFFYLCFSSFSACTLHLLSYFLHFTFYFLMLLHFLLWRECCFQNPHSKDAIFWLKVSKNFEIIRITCLKWWLDSNLISILWCWLLLNMSRAIHHDVTQITDPIILFAWRHLQLAHKGNNVAFYCSICFEIFNFCIQIWLLWLLLCQFIEFTIKFILLNIFPQLN